MTAQTFYRRYYSQLNGAHIESTTIDEDGWPVLRVRLANGDRLDVGVSRDPEGNGPGFLDGLPTPAAEPAQDEGHGYEAGQILVYSWGYGQTNVDFFVVTRVSKASVWIRPIPKRIEESHEALFTGIAYPAPERAGDFPTPKEIRKQGKRSGLSMPYGVAVRTDPAKGHHCSWGN